MAGSLFFAARIIFVRRSYALPKGGEAVAKLRGAAARLFPVFFGAALLFFPDVSATAAREGVTLCLQTVLPSLFPFFVLSSLLVQSDVPRLLSRAMAGVMYPLFGVSGAGASALILGLLGGYPVGARTVAELYGRGEIAREAAEQLLAFCNNSGPGFFLGVCGTAVFGSARAGMYLYLIHVGAALVTGVLLRRDLGLPRRKPSRSARLRGLSKDGLCAPGFSASCSTLQPVHSRKAWYVQSQPSYSKRSMQSRR